MATPTNFILNSDFASLKNDDGTSVSVTFGGSTVISANSTASVTQDVVIGAQSSINRVQIASSKDSNKRYSTQALSFSRVGSAGIYNIYAFVSRISSTTLRCRVYVPNPFGSSLTTASGDETFTFYIDTFLSPFE